jgi:hypothetical protein
MTARALLPVHVAMEVIWTSTFWTKKVRIAILTLATFATLC